MPDKFIVPERVTREAYIDLLEQLEAAREIMQKLVDVHQNTYGEIDGDHLAEPFKDWLARYDSNPARKPGRSSECGHSWWVAGCTVCEREKKDALAEQSPASRPDVSERDQAGGGASADSRSTRSRSETSDPASESEGTYHVRMQPDAEPEEHSAEGVPSESPASSPATGAGIASSSTQSEDGPEGNEGRPAPVPATNPPSAGTDPPASAGVYCLRGEHRE